MFEFIICGMSISCHWNNIKHQITAPKYPQEVAEICYYFEKQKVKLPDYCKTEIKTVRKRNEF